MIGNIIEKKVVIEDKEKMKEFEDKLERERDEIKRKAIEDRAEIEN